MKTPTWGPREISTLKRYWGDGLSAGKIHSKMPQFTRGAIDGKIRRLGLKPGKRRQAARESARAPIIVRPAPLRAMPTPITQSDNSPPPLRLSIFDLGDSTCRFPLDTRDSYGIHQFCGHKTKERSSYCVHHHVRCHDGIPERKKATATHKEYRMHA